MFIYIYNYIYIYVTGIKVSIYDTVIKRSVVFQHGTILI